MCRCANENKALLDALDAEIVDLLGLVDYNLLGSHFSDVMKRPRPKARGRSKLVVIVAIISDSRTEHVQQADRFRVSTI